MTIISYTGTMADLWDTVEKSYQFNDESQLLSFLF